MTHSYHISAIPAPPPSLLAVLGSLPPSDVIHHHRFFSQNELDTFERTRILSGHAQQTGIYFQNKAYWQTLDASASIGLLYQATDLFVNELFERIQLMKLPGGFYVPELPTKDQFIARKFSAQVADEVVVYLYRCFIACADRYLPNGKKLFVHNICIGRTEAFIQKF